ncbi:MAG: metal-sulfur cluster assembly factor [Candidatus Aenigmatarchaeota archaeon]
MEEKILKALKNTIDPETGIDVVSMGMIKEIEVKGKNVKIKFKPTTPFCPMIGYLTEQIRKEVKKVKGIEKVEVEVVF